MAKPPRVEHNFVELVDSMLRGATARGASDLHFEPSAAGMRVRYRLDGVLCDIDELPAGAADGVIARLKVLGGLLTYRTDVPQEGSFLMPGAGENGGEARDVRVATFPTICGERAVVRLFQRQAVVGGLTELGFSDPVIAALRRAAEQPNGLILVTGPAGAGKSTTLYALARQIMQVTPGRSVVSLEDPVEQRVGGLTQIQIQPHGELSYVRAMRSLLRQDVQVLLVGEIRDAETAHIVVEAALTGHLVMSTMHSGDPSEAVARLLEMGIPAYQVVSALTLVESQRLLRTVCTECAGAGCDGCSGTGYYGRTACGQIAAMNDALRQAVLERATTAQLRQVIEFQHADLLTDAQRLLQAGRTNVEELTRVFGDEGVGTS